MSSVQTDIIARFRPRTVGEIIDGAFRIYRRNFRTFLLIVVVVYLPVQLLSYFADVFLLGTYTEPDFSGSISGSLAARNLVTQIDSIKSYVVTFLEYFAQWALVVAIADVLLDRPVSFGSAYAVVRRHLGDAVGLILLQILIAVGFLAPAVLSVIAIATGGSSNSSSLTSGLLSCLSIFTLIYAIIQIRLQVILPAAANEGLSPRAALRRSWDLTRNYWWRTFALSLVLSILKSIVTLGPGALLTALVGIGFKFGVYTDLAISQGVGILTSMLYVPVEIGAIALYYYDQRVRKEAFDLDAAIAQRYEGDGGDGVGYGDEEGAGQGYGYGYGYGYGPGNLTPPVMEGAYAPGEDTEYDREEGETLPLGNLPFEPPLALPPLAPQADAPIQYGKPKNSFTRSTASDPRRSVRSVGARPAKRKMPYYPPPQTAPEQEPEQ